MKKQEKTITKEKTGKVYKITSPTGSIYIGSTIQRIENRWRYYNFLDCKDQPKLYNSFLKYGVENHTFEIIWMGYLEFTLMIERMYGDYYNTLKEGLNCQLPGYDDIPKIYSEETIIKMKNAQKGEKHHHYGKKMSEDVRRKQSLSISGDKNHMYGKRAIPTKLSVKINQYDLNGKFIKTFSSHEEISYLLNLNKQNIDNSIKRNHYVSQGFLWTKFNNSICDLDINDLPIKIDKYDLNDIYLETYDSIELAANSLNRVDYYKSILSIRNCLYGYYNNTLGFKWCYNVDKFNESGRKKQKQKEDIRKSKLRIVKNKKSVDVYDINWNYKYSFISISEASKNLECCASEISKSCSNGKTTVKGYRFKYKTNE